MKTTTTVKLLAITAAAFSDRANADCATIPSTADPKVLNAVYNTAKARNVSDRVLLATFETAWVESHANALNCGDQDSVGVFQQRPSQGWGSVAQCINVTYSTQSYLQAAIASDLKYPRYTAGQIAQSVQYSEFPDRYDQAESTAKSLIAQAQRSLGLPVSTPALSATSSSAAPIASKSGSATVTVTATIAPTTTASGGIFTSMPAQQTNIAVLAPGTIDMTCGALYSAAKGDSCSKLQDMYDSTLKQLRFWNPSINANCTNLIAGYIYCVASQVAVPPSYAASGINKQGCTGYSTKVKTGQSCTALGKKYGVSTTRIVQLNKSLNSKCSNLVVGKAYCITSIGA
ncbi:hypothetical protein EXIGLDRAFT_748949 [Exidia glandulosa HHB12029]|uniref:LysM domain-containing protein n=1 Tax=Exidia glandulosa HHB12029 TaxID=1314781 RepID=A0A165IT27_EXIGL|nr:hypothetical protein EXIGLDRAFT_748949 [Exidia glandulosa HHB12029]